MFVHASEKQSLQFWWVRSLLGQVFAGSVGFSPPAAMAQAAALERWGRSRTTSPGGKHETPAAASQSVENELPPFPTQGIPVKWLQFQGSLVHRSVIHGSSAAAARMAEPSLQKVVGVIPTG